MASVGTVYWLEVCSPDGRLVMSARLALAALGAVSASLLRVWTSVGIPSLGSWKVPDCFQFF